MEIYNYSPITGEYLSCENADKSPLEKGVFLIPAYATNKQPPQTGQNQVAIFENGNWVLKDDYRGQTGCEIDTDGFFIKQHEFIIGEKPSETIILTDIPQSIYKPKWNGTEWIQGEELPVQPPTLEERLSAIENAMLNML